MPRPPETRLVYSTEGGATGPDRDEPRKARGGPRPAPTAASARGGIRLTLDRRASDRVVTVVTGLPGSPAEVAALAKELKTACGTGGTVKDGALELQGDHRPRVEAVLDARGLRWKRSGG
ncbi:MAG: translation initiation factor [Vicinamibacteria bacterium]